MELFEVDRLTCIKDGICAEVCTTEIINFRKGEYPVPSEEAEEICIKCGHCVAACPTGSFSHRDIPVQQCPSVRSDLVLTAEQCEHFLRSRRSVRAYRNELVPRDKIQKLIEIASYAPSGHNNQCTEWLVLDNRDELHDLAGLVAGWMKSVISSKPEMASFFHMNRTLKRWENGTDVYLRGAPALIVAHTEKDNRMARSTCTIALTHLELAAASLGLGCCWAGYFNTAAATFPPLTEKLQLPAGHQPFGSMMIGYPKFAYHRMPSRRTPVITYR